MRQVSVLLALGFLVLAAPLPAKTIVVSDSGALQGALQSALDGDTIELRGGVYRSPANGFNLSNLRKALVMRAAGGADVILEGDGQRPLVRFENASANRGKKVTFRDLTFHAGASASKTRAGGVSLRAAKAQFENCLFLDNVNTSPAGGGALRIAHGSKVTLIDTEFRHNVARSRGGALEVVQSALVMRRGSFEGNGTNRPGHAAKAVGGAAYLLDAQATFIDVRFSANGSGWVGGAVYVFGTWSPKVAPTSRVLFERVTFEDNVAGAAPGEPTAGRDEGGAIHAEDDTEVRIRSSLFRRNSAQVGGALHSYRAAFDIEDSVFLDNRARIDPGAPSVGGTIAVESNDQNGPSTQNGAVNRPSGALALRRSLVQGPFGSAAAKTGGCLFVDGDLSRHYGTGSVPQDGAPAFNRATVLIERSVLARCRTGASGVPLGGALRAALVQLALTESLIIDSASPEAGGGGGALALVDQTAAVVETTSFANNLAERWGGAVFLSASRLDVTHGKFWRNSLGPAGVASIAESRGAAIYSLPRGSGGVHGPVDITGVIAASTFSSSRGLALWDVESPNDTAINDLRYEQNQFSESSFGAAVYRFSQESPQGRSPAGLNALVIQRVARPSTDKSSTPNVATPRPRDATLLSIQGAGSPGAREGPFLAFAWEGFTATLDGVGLGLQQGLVNGVGPGRHVLLVAGSTQAATADVD